MFSSPRAQARGLFLSCTIKVHSTGCLMTKSSKNNPTAIPPTKEYIYSVLNTVIDPELHIGIVDLGLLYDVSIAQVQSDEGKRTKIHVLMTLTTPGCPLAGVFEPMVKQALVGEVEDVEQDVTVELTFDPPWLIEMMNPEARARLGM